MIVLHILIGYISLNFVTQSHLNIHNVLDNA